MTNGAIGWATTFYVCALHCLLLDALSLQEVMERNKKIQQDKKITYDMKVAEVTNQTAYTSHGHLVRFLFFRA